MGLLDRVRGMFSSRGEREEREGIDQAFMGSGMVVLSNPSLVEVTAVPSGLVRRLWGLIEKDSAYSFLDENEVKWLSFKVERIASIATMVEPEVWHPEIVKMIDRAILSWVDKENASLLGYLRLKRSWRGMERRLSTVTASRYAY